jgi:hypothetical protein
VWLVSGDMSRTVRAYQRAIRAWDLAQCAFAVRESEDVYFVTGYTRGRLECGIDGRILVDKCNNSGWLLAWLNGIEWERIPACKKKICCGKCQRRLRVDIRELRRELKEGGYL